MHVKLLGWLYIVAGVFWLLLGLLMFGLMTGAGMMSGAMEGFWISSMMGGAIGTFFLVIAAPHVIAGAGLLARKGWAWYLTAVLAAINVFNPPLGTVLGLYSFWVLFRGETRRAFGTE